MKNILFIQNDPTDPPHLVGRWLEEEKCSISIIHAYRGEAVPTTVPEGVNAIIPLGGHMSAWDDEVAPWLPAERELIRDAYAKDIPVFGICLGAQLIALALGGKVERGELSEIGIYDIENVHAGKNDPVFSFESPTPAALWHEDFVTELPEGATTLASSEICPNQIFTFGSRSYALQFHPEVDAPLFQSWEDYGDNAFENFHKETVMPEVKAAEANLTKTWEGYIKKWASLV
jgi:GMP synthase (glutamine-hydrolysing)